MNQTDKIERVGELEAQLAALRSQVTASEHALHARMRDEELEFRLSAMRTASSGEKPVQSVQAAYWDLIRQVDVEETEKLVRQLHERGYVIVEGLLTPNEIEHAREALAPIYKGTAKLFGSVPNKQTMHVQNVLAKTERIDAIATLPRLRALIAGILGIDFILNAGAVAMSPDPGCEPQGLHRDDGFYTLFPRPRVPLVVTAAIALDDFTPENGGTQVVPGSNCWPESRQPDPADVMLCEMPAGSALIWDGAVLHGGGGNSTERSRRTLTLNYARGWLRTQFNQYLSIPRERVLAMPAELQTDLGYHRSAMGLGGCDLQDPLAYLERLQEAGGDGAQSGLGYESREHTQEAGSR
ncbi:MAG: hypothetical protein CMQ29_12390 [Gammaproteobacteria bacterium]|nr:hypothetical protein [Gammaproteobacteria bacterium]